MICVLDVTSGPASGKRFWIRTNETVQIGRISTADFSVPADQHMSRHHLILEGFDSTFRIRDVGSANGTYVNDAKVSTIELCNGDRIKAGETTFEVSVLDDAENPHAREVTFNSSAISDSVGNAAKADVIEQVRPANHSDAPPRSPIPVVHVDAKDLSDPDLSDPVNADSDDDSTRRVSGRFWQDSSSEGSSSIGPWKETFAFRPTDHRYVYQQSAEAKNGRFLSDLLRHLETRYALTAIIQTSGLSAFDEKLLATFVEAGLAHWVVGQEVCLLANASNREFYFLADNLIEQDAITLIGSAGRNLEEICAAIASTYPRPSLLGESLFSKQNSTAEHFLTEVDLALFRRKETPELYVFHPER